MDAFRTLLISPDADMLALFDGLPPVNLEEIPHFNSESDEAEFWANHRLSDRTLEGMSTASNPESSLKAPAVDEIEAGR